MKIHFITPTRISLINLTTIGDSEKRDDPTKIGKFSSGQAYATALLLRDNVGIKIRIKEDYNTTEVYTYSTKKLVCETTNKSKEVIVLHQTKFSETKEIETAFALQLGYNWELWMAYRELMSNVIDEGGYVLAQEETPQTQQGTIITLEFNETNLFYEVWKNKHLYMNFNEPLFKINSSLEALENKEGYLRIYKQNILVYENKERKSFYAYNIKFGHIDERRILSNVYSVECDIANYILETRNEEFLRTIITHDFEVDKGDFLYSPSTYYGASDLINQITGEVYQVHGQVNSYPFIIQKVKERKDCKIGGKIITTIEDSLWSYSKKVTVETIPQPKELTFAEEIKKHYNFDLDCEVKKAKLKGNKVVADKYLKCLIIDEEFSVEEDFKDLIVEYIDLTMEGNVVENLSQYICKLLKK